jgi:general stress protein 26
MNVNEVTHARRKLWELIGKARFAMFVTLEANGALRGRPMTTIQDRFDDALWFFAKADSDVVRAVHANPQVCLTYGNSDAADFVSVSGRARVVTDVDRKQQLWNAAVQAWFPEGAESPGVVLLDVLAESGEYWDSANQLVRMLSMARALSTSTTPKNMGEHEKLSL